MSRCFITQQVPASLVVKFNISQAGVNFCNHLVESNLFDQAFALPILSVVPNIQDECKKDKNYIYIQTRFFKHKSIGKAFNAIIENLTCVYLAASYKNIWFYNLNRQTLLSFIILRYILFKKVYVLVADFRPGHKWSVNSLIHYLIDHSKGIITLSNRSVFTNRNAVCIPGIVPLPKISRTINPITERSFLLSGVLKEATGITMAIEVFSKMPSQKLFISGILDEVYQEQIKPSANICYVGYLEYEEYKRLIGSIPIGLSLRDPSFPINENNFPSKILEYFALNKIVLSTIDYPEIEGFNYFKCNYNADEITDLIQQIAQMDESDLRIYMQHSENLENSVSEKAWTTAFSSVEKGL